MKRIIEATEHSDPIMSALVIVAVCTGLRRSELLGLRWQDVDIKRGVLNVSRAVKTTSEGVKTGDTKTHSQRLLRLDSATMAILGTHRANMERITRTPVENSAHIFTWDPAGNPTNPTTASARFMRICRRLGIQSRFHDLRHAAATGMLADGVDIATVAHRLGHANSRITIAVYAHSLVASDELAASVISKKLLRLT